MYVSITGLKLKSFWHVFRFYRHAVPSLRQAQKAEGNLCAQVRTINGVHHTLTAWESEKHMRAFLYSGAHKKAIKSFPKIATGKTFGFESDTIPDWSDVHQLWQDHGEGYKKETL
jgi:hypothetical protein